MTDEQTKTTKATQPGRHVKNEHDSPFKTDRERVILAALQWLASDDESEAWSWPRQTLCNLEPAFNGARFATEPTRWRCLNAWKGGG